MATEVRINWSAVARSAIVAGIVGGITLDLFLWVATLLPAHQTILGLWQFVASGAVGPVAYTNINYAWLGLVVHFIVSIGWAGGYAYLAQTQTYLYDRWVISGLVYGFVVYIFMQLLMLGAHVFKFPDNADVVAIAVIAHCVFFGLPVAFVVARQK